MLSTLPVVHVNQTEDERCHWSIQLGASIKIVGHHLLWSLQQITAQFLKVGLPFARLCRAFGALQQRHRFYKELNFGDVSPWAC